MAPRPLELEVLRKGKHEDRFDAHGDPEDLQWMTGRLRGWLQRNHWHEARWVEFEIVSREKDGGRILTRTGA